ncbi:unnamed protein product [Closterium sp. NIES-54]
MHVRNERYGWEMDGLDLQHFFRSLGNTLAGEAEAFYLEIRDPLLQEEERDEEGRLLRDEEGKPIRLRDPTERFLQELAAHFPTQTPARIREFDQLRRGSRESLLGYYRRVHQLAEDIGCSEPRIIVAKFLDGLAGELARTVRDRTYDLGPNATLRQAYEIAWRHEQSLSLYDMGRKTDKPPRERERRGVGWGGALMTGEEAEEEDQERDRASRSRTRKPRSAAHSPGEEPVCYKCREPGHFKRDCPKLQTCSYCQRKGHQADNCYTKQREQKGRGGRRGRIEELEEELRRLRAEEEDTMAEEEKPVHVARYAEESDEEGPEPIFMAANPGREREDLGLLSGAADGRRGTTTVRRGPRATIDEAVEEAAGAAEEAMQRAVARMGPRRHPFERMVARPCVVEALEGMVAVEGKYPSTTIIDTGASQVLVGRRLAERLGLHRAENVTPEGVRIQTAEGGDGTWLPRTIRPQEVVLAPGRAEETRIRVHCLVSDLEDYDLLLGMELLYKVGAVVDTWAERVTYQPLYWDLEATRAGEEGAVLPARFLRGRVEYREPHHQRVPEQRWEDAGVYLERAASRRRMEEAAGARVEELREARGLAEPAYDFETFNRPVRLVELFGGVGPGLAACVRLGMVVEQWTYVEKNPEVRRMAMHHAVILHERFPDKLSRDVVEQARLEAERMSDVTEVTEEVVASWGQVDLLVAGWECQGLSRAGRGRGLEDPRMALFQELIRVMKLIKQRQGPFSYVVENLDVADDERSLVKEAHRAVTRELGHGVAWDAAQMGARAHRIRRYWQNMVPETVLRDQLGRMRRPLPLLVQDILEPGRRVAPVVSPDIRTQYPCNEVGAPRQAWPTLVSTPGSYAFSMQGDQPGPGMVQVLATGEWEGPLAVERERAMGYLRNATAAEGVSEEVRRQALGGAIDQHALGWLLYRAEKRHETLRAQLLMLQRYRDFIEMTDTEPEMAMEVAAQWRQSAVYQREERAREEDQFNRQGMVLMAKGARAERSKENTEGEVEGREEAPVEGAQDRAGEWQMGDGPNEGQKEKMRRVLGAARGAFAFSVKELGKCNRAVMDIELQSQEPVYQRRRRMSPGDRDIAEEKCKELLEAGLIRESTSEYAAATVVAARKDLTGETISRRMCGDYRGLNRVTKSDRYPMPVVEELFDELSKGRVYTTLDLRQGFNQIPI